MQSRLPAFEGKFFGAHIREGGNLSAKTGEGVPSLLRKNTVQSRPAARNVAQSDVYSFFDPSLNLLLDPHGAAKQIKLAKCRTTLALQENPEILAVTDLITFKVGAIASDEP